ncbi:Conserved protein of unknown function [Magnetospira sp. QH-2]|nr:Conserved protein of unknown function [Magnetospira sp. QH-2]
MNPGDWDNELHSWRKHPDLHGWMWQLYLAKGGTYRRFNCRCVQLTLEDLDRLEMDIVTNRLPFTDGVFFGWSDGSEKEDDLAFVTKARAALQAGEYVYYMADY